MSIEGENLKDFSNQSWYLQIIGEDISTNHDVYNYTNISGLTKNYKTATVSNIRITGCDINSEYYPHRTGFYTVSIRNSATGVGILKSGLYVSPPIDEARMGTASHAGSGATYYSASYPITFGSGKDSTTYSAFTGFMNHRSGAWICTFSPISGIDISRILFYQNNLGSNIYPLPPTMIKTLIPGYDHSYYYLYCVTKFNIQLYDSNVNLLYSGNALNISQTNQVSFLTAPTGKVKQMRIYSSGNFSAYDTVNTSADDIESLYLGFNNIEVY